MLPDPELLSKLSWLQSSALTPQGGLGMELVSIMDFFLALSICNSVVVSSPHQPPPVVSPTMLHLIMSSSLLKEIQDLSFGGSGPQSSAESWEDPVEVVHCGSWSDSDVQCSET